jgi:hypothetical protein
MKLLLSQKNEMYSLINQHGLGHDRFRYSEYRKRRRRLYTKVTFGRGTNYSFVIVSYGGKLFKTRQSPSEHKFREELMHDGWLNVLHQFDHWLCCLKHEAAQPDLWAGKRLRPFRFLFSTSVKDAVNRFLLAGRL